MLLQELQKQEARNGRAQSSPDLADQATAISSGKIFTGRFSRRYCGARAPITATSRYECK
jgi:hypothetical protein